MKQLYRGGWKQRGRDKQNAMKLRCTDRNGNQNTPKKQIELILNKNNKDCAVKMSVMIKYYKQRYTFLKLNK